MVSQLTSGTQAPPADAQIAPPARYRKVRAFRGMKEELRIKNGKVIGPAPNSVLNVFQQKGRTYLTLLTAQTVEYRVTIEYEAWDWGGTDLPPVELPEGYRWVRNGVDGSWEVWHGELIIGYARKYISETAYQALLVQRGNDLNLGSATNSLELLKSLAQEVERTFGGKVLEWSWEVEPPFELPEGYCWVKNRFDSSWEVHHEGCSNFVGYCLRRSDKYIVFAKKRRSMNYSDPLEALRALVAAFGDEEWSWDGLKSPPVELPEGWYWARSLDLVWEVYRPDGALAGWCSAVTGLTGCYEVKLTDTGFYQRYVGPLHALRALVSRVS